MGCIPGTVVVPFKDILRNVKLWEWKAAAVCFTTLNCKEKWLSGFQAHEFGNLTSNFGEKECGCWWFGFCCVTVLCQALVEVAFSDRRWVLRRGLAS